MVRIIVYHPVDVNEGGDMCRYESGYLATGKT